MTTAPDQKNPRVQQLERTLEITIDYLRDLEKRGVVFATGGEDGSLVDQLEIVLHANPPEPQFFRTVAEMHTVPSDRLHAFCVDLELWLQAHQRVGLSKVTTPTDVFGWLDDGRHEMRLVLSRRSNGLGGDTEAA